jgi:hypothetical protein
MWRQGRPPELGARARAVVRDRKCAGAGACPHRSFPSSSPFPAISFPFPFPLLYYRLHRLLIAPLFFHSVWSDVGTDPTGAAVAEPFLEGVVWK